MFVWTGISVVRCWHWELCYFLCCFSLECGRFDVYSSGWEQRHTHKLSLSLSPFLYVSSQFGNVSGLGGLAADTAELKTVCVNESCETQCVLLKGKGCRWSCRALLPFLSLPLTSPEIKAACSFWAALTLRSIVFVLLQENRLTLENCYLFFRSSTQE